VCIEESGGERMNEPAVQRSDHMIRNGIIVSVLFPVLGVAWGIALLVRDRAKEGLIVLSVALALGGAYALVYTTFINPSKSAYDSSVKEDVEAQIRINASKANVILDDVRCVAKSDSTMKCLGTLVDNDRTRTQVTYEVTVDHDGSYIIDESWRHPHE
jgi:hypothetical protein